MAFATSSRLRDDDGRLRTWLRVLLVIVAMVAASLLGDLPFVLLDVVPATAAAGLLTAILSVALFTWLARRLDRRGIRSYGLHLDRRWWRDFGAGALMGVALGALSFAFLLAGGWASVTEVWSPGEAGGSVALALAASLVMYAAIALWEELVFRGHLISNAAEALARRRRPRRAVVGALIVSLPVFALGHANQFVAPGAPAALAVWHWVAMAGLLGLAYVGTGQLGLPMGLHFTVNLSFNQIFGLPGELGADLASVVRLQLDGPGWIVGVGGAAHLAAVAATYLLLWGWLRLRPEGSRIHESIATRGPATTRDEIGAADERSKANMSR